MSKYALELLVELKETFGTGADSVFDPLMAEIQADDQQKLCPQCGCCVMVKKKCWACGGVGSHETETWVDAHIVLSDRFVCRTCNGTGYEPCEWCLGTGTITSTSFFEVGGGQYQKMNIDMECTKCKGEKLQRVCAGGCSTGGRHK